MAVEQPLTCALIGTGMVARTHFAALQGLKTRVKLKGVCARRRENAEKFAANTYNLHVYDDTEAVALDHELDFVIIATPPNARLGIIQPLSDACLHILLEKPIARNLEEAVAIVQLCETAGVKLGLVLQHRMREASLKAAELIAEGELGALGMVEINVPWWREQAYYDEPGRGTLERDGGGVLISQAIHTIDLALSLSMPSAGRVVSVQAMTATTAFHTMETEDVATAGLRFENGAVGSLTASTASFPGGAETITLHHEKASLLLGGGVLTVSWRDGRVDTFGASATTGGGADPMAFTHEWHQGIINDFIDSIHESRHPVATGREALQSHRLIDAIERSSHEGKRVDLAA